MPVVIVNDRNAHTNAQATYFLKQKPVLKSVIYKVLYLSIDRASYLRWNKFVKEPLFFQVSTLLQSNASSS